MVLVLENDLPVTSTAALRYKPGSSLPGVTETNLSLLRDFVNHQQIVSVAQQARSSHINNMVSWG